MGHMTDSSSPSASASSASPSSASVLVVSVITEIVVDYNTYVKVETQRTGFIKMFLMVGLKVGKVYLLQQCEAI